MPGVHAVITGADMPGGPPIIPMRLQPLPEFKPFEQPVIAHDKVRYVGEPIAVVLADSVAIGEDALEAIAVEIEELAAGRGLADARRRAQSLLFEKPGTNRSLVFQRAQGRRRRGLRATRLTSAASSCAPAATTGSPWSRAASWRMGRRPRASSRSLAPPRCRSSTAASCRRRSACRSKPIEMIENDVGGGYGARGEFYPEDFLIPFAARHVNRPVKWIEDRRENLMAMNHAREEECDLEIACARDGTILAIRGEVHTDMGAYMRTNGAVGARNVAQFMAGPYRVPHVKIDSSLWMTNKTPVGTYRGPGRFEANFFLERMIDMIAADLGIDRIEFRRKNLITSAEQPYPIAHVQPTDAKDEYDSGDYRATLDRALKEIDWPKVSKLAGQADRRQVSRPRRGLLHRGRRRRPEGNRAARGQRRRHHLGLSWARRRSGRASRPSSRRSPPMRSRCRSSASVTSITARQPM